MEKVDDQNIKSYLFTATTNCKCSPKSMSKTYSKIMNG